MIQRLLCLIGFHQPINYNEDGSEPRLGSKLWCKSCGVTWQRAYDGIAPFHQRLCRGWHSPARTCIVKPMQVVNCNKEERHG